MVRNTTAAMTKAEFFTDSLHEIYLGTLCTLQRICYTKSYARHNDNDWLHYKSIMKLQKSKKNTCTIFLCGLIAEYTLRK